MSSFSITLPWPPAALSPNRRAHWGDRAKATAKYREDARYAAQAAGARVLEWPGAVLTITAHPSTNRNRDGDNLIASLKSGFDGIADATGINDSRFTIGAPVFAEPRKAPCVIVEITRA